MNKTIKMLMKVMPVMLVLVVCATSVFGVDASMPSGGSEIEGVTTLAGNIWSTVVVIVQILAFAAVIFAGVRYMFASADVKADIKGQTVILVAGAILVFAAEPVIGFIKTTVESVFPS